MAISLTDLFNRLGGHYGIAKTQIDARAAIVTRATNLDGQYTSGTRFMYTPVLNQFLSIYNSSDATLSNALSGATKTLVEMVNADNPSVPKQTLAAMGELNRQMRMGSPAKYLLQNTITQGSVSAATSNVGTGTVLLHGIPSQMSRSETLYFQCIGDTTTGQTSGQETFAVTSSASYPSLGDSRWPGGTALSTGMTSNDYSGNPNVVSNGTFDSWTASVPDNWTVGGDTAGIKQLTSGAFRGSSALWLDNHTSRATLQQNLGSFTLGPGKRIIFGCWAKRVAGVPTRDINIELEGAGGAYATLDIAPASTSWVLYKASYQHDWYAPQETMTLTIGKDQESAGISVAIDGMFVYVPPQMGTNGQFIQIIAGATDWRIGDYLTVTISNNYASTVLSYTERFFAPFANGIELPTNAAGANTIDNSVIP